MNIPKYLTPNQIRALPKDIHIKATAIKGYSSEITPSHHCLPHTEYELVWDKNGNYFCHINHKSKSGQFCPWMEEYWTNVYIVDPGDFLNMISGNVIK